MSLALGPQEAPLLLLLEARHAAGERPAEPDPWRLAAARLLRRARDGGVLVGHVFRGAAAEAARWRVMPELRPDPAEPVFYAPPGEPFDNPALARFVARAGRAPIVLAGNSTGGGCLTTALWLVTDGRQVSVASDALSCTPKEWKGLEALAGLPELLSGGRLTLGGAAAVPVRPRLTVIPGGRR